MLRRFAPDAVFSMGGYVAGPGDAGRGAAPIPLVVMEPNAIPGSPIADRARLSIARWSAFEETARWFPARAGPR